jgi:L-ectoine synthase
MIFKEKSELVGTARHVEGPVWSSTRYFVKADGLGFSLHETIVEAGSVQMLWYKNHIEANVMIEGEAEVEDPATGEIHRLGPGSAYALDRHDRHIFRALTRCRLICVFNPALSGQETHDADGSYSLD